MGSKPRIVPSFHKKDSVLWADRGWEAGTWFLSIGALVPSLLLISCYPEWSLFCITVTIKNA